MIVEGYRECRRALDRGYRPRALFHCPDFYLKNENEPQLVADCERLGASVFTCSRVCFEKIAYKERPDGLLMVGPHVSIGLADLKLPENVRAVFDQNFAVVSVLMAGKDDDAAEGEGDAAASA